VDFVVEFDFLMNGAEAEDEYGVDAFEGGTPMLFSDKPFPSAETPASGVPFSAEAVSSSGEGGAPPVPQYGGAQGVVPSHSSPYSSSPSSSSPSKLGSFALQKKQT